MALVSDVGVGPVEIPLKIVAVNKKKKGVQVRNLPQKFAVAGLSQC
jgi:hypothetical protein